MFYVRFGPTYGDRKSDALLVNRQGWLLLGRLVTAWGGWLLLGAPARQADITSSTVKCQNVATATPPPLFMIDSHSALKVCIENEKVYNLIL